MALHRLDAVIVGGGHNGLIAAAYLARAGRRVCVLERRSVLGGAASTEAVLGPNTRCSRFSYVAGLIRPDIVANLELARHGCSMIPRFPASFTPTKQPGRYLLLGQREAEKDLENIREICGKDDADSYLQYEQYLDDVRQLVQPLLNRALPKFDLAHWREIAELVRHAYRKRDTIMPAYELVTAPAKVILDRFFDSDILKATLATDSVIGSMNSPSSTGSGYVLLHHIFGESEGRKGVWSYVKGGMGALSNAIAEDAREHGAELITDAEVSQILYEALPSGHKHTAKATGVQLANGTKIEADVVISNATPDVTFLKLLPSGVLPRTFERTIRSIDYSSGVMKINLEVDCLPNFICWPNRNDSDAGDQHHGTIHFENSIAEIEAAYQQALRGIPADRPVIEMTIPSSVDTTLAPAGRHVVQLFIQYAPYNIDPTIGSWHDKAFSERYADRIFSIIDEFAPGFSQSIRFKDILTPVDIEQILGLTGGNIFHGAMSMHQLMYSRPAAGYARHSTPLQNLFLCGSGAHPGGGVMGAAGRNAASIVLNHLEKR